MIATPARDPQSCYRSIVTVTSANAEIVGADRADYCMTKAALAMMSKLFAARPRCGEHPRVRDPARHHSHRDDAPGNAKVRPADRKPAGSPSRGGGRPTT
jgi:hypothetical protein